MNHARTLALTMMPLVVIAGCGTADRGWRHGAAAMSATDEPPMVCTLTPEQLSATREGLLPGLLKRADKREALPNGYRMTFTPKPGLLAEIAGIIEQERGCCQFLTFNLTVAHSNGPITFDVTGPAGTREMLDSL